MISEYDELQEWPIYNEVPLRLLNLNDLEKSSHSCLIKNLQVL